MTVRPRQIQTVIDKAPHDFRLVSWSRVGGIEKASYRCTRCGGWWYEKTYVVKVCEEQA